MIHSSDLSLYRFRDGSKMLRLRKTAARVVQIHYFKIHIKHTYYIKIIIFIINAENANRSMINGRFCVFDLCDV